MKYIILCGGRGERFLFSYPKPLNRVCGRMIGEWMVQSLLKNNKIDELIWILNPKLYDYNIEDEIIRWTKGINNKFIKLPFETRDASETLEVAIPYFDFNEDFICLDNDNIYIDGLDKFQSLLYTDSDAAILVAMMESGKEYPPRYGFIKVENEIIVDGKEKIIGWGETHFSYGAYWFRSVDICSEWLKIQRSDMRNNNGERSLLNLIVKYSRKTKAIITRESFSIGTPQDCADAEINKSKYFGWQGARIVVDLDNTLVTYPKVHGDYTTSLPQNNIVEWIKDKELKGAEIIIYSARRMRTHNGNIGKVNVDIGLTTFQCIKNLNINVKEIYLGKPNGDIYIDDSSINPFDRNWMITSGDWQGVVNYNPMNSLPITRDVSIKMKQVEHVIKTGSIEELRGQKHYYEYLNNSETGRSIRYLFPQCYNITSDSNNTYSLDLEYIKGVPASYLWCHNLWSNHEWNLCIESLKSIHSMHIREGGSITNNDIMRGYIEKCEIRRGKYEIFTKLDPDAVLWNTLKERILLYKPNNICRIHGDSFLGNIIFPMSGGIKFIDMRGELNGFLTIYGDPLYDFSKLCTSLLGTDSIIYGLPIRPINDGLEWIHKLDNYEIIISLALVLMYGIIGFYKFDISEKIIARIYEILSIIC